MKRDIVPASIDLTAYELDQIRRIAAWKSRAPTRAGAGFISKVSKPGVRLLGRIVPSRLVVGCIEHSYQVALRMARADRAEPAPENLSEEQFRSLEQCDALAACRCATANAVALMHGALTGAGGFLTTFADIPLLLALSMQTVMRVGRSYGYSLEEQGDRRFVVGVLVAGSSGSLKIKRQRLMHLDMAHEWAFGQSQEELIAEELFALLFQMELFQEVPGLSSLTAGLLNLGFVRNVGETARIVFQERWLRDHRGIATIEPTVEITWNRQAKLGTKLSRAASSTCYCLGFSMALPASVVASSLTPLGGLVKRGRAKRVRTVRK